MAQQPPFNVIIELDPYTLRAGIASDQSPIPSLVIPCAVGKNHQGEYTFDEKASSIYPLSQDYVIDDMEAMQALLQHVISTLAPSTNPDNIYLTLVVSIWMPHPVRKAFLNLVFTSLRVFACFIGDRPLMAAFGAAQSTCLVIDVNEIFSLPKLGDENFKKVANKRIVEVTAVVEFVPQLVTAERYVFTSTAGSSTDDDGSKVPTTSSARKNSSTTNNESDETSIGSIVWNVISQSEADKRRAMLNSIILTGITNIKQVREELSSQLKPFLATSDYCADTQPTSLAFKSIPEFYADSLRNVKSNLSIDVVAEGIEAVGLHITWFGAMVAGKTAFANVGGIASSTLATGEAFCHKRDEWDQK